MCASSIASNLTASFTVRSVLRLWVDLLNTRFIISSIELPSNGQPHTGTRSKLTQQPLDSSQYHFDIEATTCWPNLDFIYALCRFFQHQRTLILPHKKKKKKKSQLHRCLPLPLSLTTPPCYTFTPQYATLTLSSAKCTRLNSATPAVLHFSSA